MPRKAGESLNEYIVRLVRFGNSQQLRVPDDFVDKDGNVLIDPVVIYGTDATGRPRHILNTSGEFVDPASNKSAYHAPPNEASAAASATAPAQVIIPANQFHEVMGVVASFDVDATAVNRTCVLRVRLGRAVVPTITVLETLFIVGGRSLTLSASEFGLIWADPLSNVVSENDNGTTTITADVCNLPRFLNAGDIVEGIITANGQAGDRLHISVISRRME